MISNQHLLTNSDSRNIAQRVNDFSVDFVNNVDDFKAVGVQVVSIGCVHLFPNIYEPYNVLYLKNTVTDSVEVVTISGGQYNANQMAATLEAAFLAQLGWAVTVSIDTLTFKLSIVPAPGPPQDTSRFLSISELRNTLSSAAPPLSLNYYLGTPWNTTPAVWPTELSNSVNLTGPQIVYVRSAALTHNAAIGSEESHVDYIGHIDLSNTSYGSQVSTRTADPHFKSFTYRGDRSLSNIDYVLTDHFGTRLPLPDNVNLFVELIMTKNNTIH
jgi:hypothetical protein